MAAARAAIACTAVCTRRAPRPAPGRPWPDRRAGPQHGRELVAHRGQPPRRRANRTPPAACAWARQVSASGSASTSGVTTSSPGWRTRRRSAAISPGHVGGRRRPAPVRVSSSTSRPHPGPRQQVHAARRAPPACRRPRSDGGQLRVAGSVADGGVDARPPPAATAVQVDLGGVDERPRVAGRGAGQVGDVGQQRERPAHRGHARRRRRARRTARGTGSGVDLRAGGQHGGARRVERQPGGVLRVQPVGVAGEHAAGRAQVLGVGGQPCVVDRDRVLQRRPDLRPHHRRPAALVVQVERERAHADRVQPPRDDVQRGALLGDEQHPLALGDRAGEQVGDGLRLAGAGRALQHEGAPGAGLGDRPQLRRRRPAAGTARPARRGRRRSAVSRDRVGERLGRRVRRRWATSGLSASSAQCSSRSFQSRNLANCRTARSAVASTRPGQACPASAARTACSAASGRCPRRPRPGRPAPGTVRPCSRRSFSSRH